MRIPFQKTIILLQLSLIALPTQLFAMMQNEKNNIDIILPPKNIVAPQTNDMARLQQQVKIFNDQVMTLQQQLSQIQENINRIAANKNIKNAAFQAKWLDAKNGNYPKDAFIAAYDDKKPIYVCHVNFLEGVHPGQLVKDGCYISYKHQAFVKPNYQVLVSDTQKYSWIAAGNSDIDNINNGNMVAGGYEDSDQHSLFVCRTIYDNHIHVGKVVSGKCNIGIDSIEIEVPNYEVLVNN